MSRRTRSIAKTLSRAASAPAMITSQPAIPTMTFESSAAWEAWLESSHASIDGLWLQIGKKGIAGSPTVTYDEAVDGALCFGWIDGQRRSHSATHFLQRFTPRRPRSLWSRRNVDKVAALTAAGRMRESGLAEVAAARADGRWARAYAGPATVVVPGDLQAALDANAGAAAFFSALNKSQRYSFLWRIETATRPETRRRRIGQAVEMLAAHETHKK